MGSEGRFWIGGQRNSANGFEWTDYSDFTYTKWEVGQPSISNGETAETCISVYSTGIWKFQLGMMIVVKFRALRTIFHRYKAGMT